MLFHSRFVSSKGSVTWMIGKIEDDVPVRVGGLAHFDGGHILAEICYFRFLPSVPLVFPKKDFLVG